MAVSLINEYSYLGQQMIGLPEFGIFIPKNYQWCTGVSTNLKQRSTEVVTEWDPALEVFRSTMCYDKLQRLSDVYRHFNTVFFDINPSTKSTNYDFAFYLDNTKMKTTALMYLYSHQDEEMVVDGYCVKPNEKKTLLRHTKYDRAFSLNVNPAKAKQNISSKDMFTSSIKKDVCSFTAIITQARMINPPTRKCYVDEVDGASSYSDDGDDDSDNDIDHAYGGLRVQVDGVRVQADGGKSNTYRHANFVKGQKTNQLFKEVELVYDNAPIHIYNFVICLK